MMYLSDTINPLPFLTGHYLPLALVCQQWRAFLKQQDEDYITYYSTACFNIAIFKSLHIQDHLERFFEHIARSRNLELIRYAIFKKFPMSDLGLECIAEVKSLALNKRVFKKEIPLYIFKKLIAVDDMDSIIYFIDIYDLDSWAQYIIPYMALRNRYDIIEQIYLSDAEMLLVGIENGKYLEYEKFTTPCIDTLIYAVKAGKVDIVLRILEHVPVAGKIFCRMGFKDESVPALQVLLDNGVIFKENCFTFAILEDQFHVLQWAHSVGYLQAIAVVALLETSMRDLSVNMVRWLIERSGPQPRTSIVYSGQNVEIFDLLFQANFPWDEHNIFITDLSGEICLKEWLLLHGALLDPDYISSLWDFRLFKIHYNGLVSPDTMIYLAIISGEMKFLKMAIREGGVPVARHFKMAAGMDQLHMLVLFDKIYRIKASLLSHRKRFSDRVCKWLET